MMSMINHMILVSSNKFNFMVSALKAAVNQKYIIIEGVQKLIMTFIALSTMCESIYTLKHMCRSIGIPKQFYHADFTGQSKQSPELDF